MIDIRSFFNKVPAAASAVTGTNSLSHTPGEPDSAETELDLPEIQQAEPIPRKWYDEWDKPNQPGDVSVIPPFFQQKKKLAFQQRWFEVFPWLHYSEQQKGVLCFYCAKASNSGLSQLAKNAEPAFTTAGFRNWKKAIERFSNHQTSKSHTFCVQQLLQQKAPIDAALLVQTKENQAVAKRCLTSVITSVRFLARQGLSFRGHDSTEGNLAQLLELRSTDLPELRNWLKRKTDFTSPDIQNEILSLLANSVLWQIRDRIGDRQYSVIVDCTKDISGTEQESLCIRYVADDLTVYEDFVGFFAVPDTTGLSLSKCIKDAFLPLQLSMAKLRGQTYDGAANMSGCYNGTQALIREEQPLALYVHCGAHCTDLALQSALRESGFVKDCIQLVHELGILYNKSSKFRSAFREVATQADASSVALKPLCPTRWTVRTPAVCQVFNQYESVLSSLQELSTSVPETDVSSLHVKFQSGSTVLGLRIALTVMEPVEILNKVLQGRKQTISGMRQAVDFTKILLQNLRTEASFQTVWEAASDIIDACNLDPVSLPHYPWPSKRGRDADGVRQASSSYDFYRHVYYEMTDQVILQLEERFSQESLSFYGQIEQMLLEGKVNDSAKKLSRNRPPPTGHPAAHVPDALQVLINRRGCAYFQNNGSRGAAAFRSGGGAPAPSVVNPGFILRSGKEFQQLAAFENVAQVYDDSGSPEQCRHVPLPPDRVRQS